MEARKNAARRSCNYRRAYRPLVKVDAHSLSQLEERRRRERNFLIGSYGAAVLMCLMFLFLSVGVVMFGW